MSRVVDIERVRASFARLDAHAVQYPEVFAGHGAEAWLARMRKDQTMTTEESINIGVRLPVALLARVDAYALAQAKVTQGITINRSTAIRMLLTRALDAEEPKAKGKGRRA